MARNFKETEKMKEFWFFILTIVTGLLLCSSGFTQERKQQNEFTVVFSANVNGELEPCG